MGEQDRPKGLGKVALGQGLHQPCRANRMQEGKYCGKAWRHATFASRLTREPPLQRGLLGSSTPLPSVHRLTNSVI